MLFKTHQKGSCPYAPYTWMRLYSMWPYAMRVPIFLGKGVLLGAFDLGIFS